MKKKFLTKTTILTSLCVLLLGFTVCAERLGNGKAEWTGGENKNNIVYSRITDMKKDGFRNYGCVYVQNDKGVQNSKRSHTTGKGKYFETTIKATHEKPLISEKAWYSDYFTDRVKGE